MATAAADRAIVASFRARYFPGGRLDAAALERIVHADVERNRETMTIGEAEWTVRRVDDGRFMDRIRDKMQRIYAVEDLHAAAALVVGVMGFYDRAYWLGVLPRVLAAHTTEHTDAQWEELLRATATRDARVAAEHREIYRVVAFENKAAAAKYGPDWTWTECARFDLGQEVRGRRGARLSAPDLDLLFRIGEAYRLHADPRYAWAATGKVWS